MEFTIHYFIEANLYLVSLYFIYKGFIQPAKNYTIARPFLVFGILFSLGLPFIALQPMNVTYSELNLSAVLAEVSVSATETTTSAISSLLFWMKVIYVLGVLALLGGFVIQLVQILKVKTKATKKDSHFELEQSTAAYSFMNWIFIGSNYSSEEKTVLLRHEQVHVTKKHSLDILLCQALKIAFWMNPLAYKFKTLFQEIHEYEADELSWQEHDSYLHLLIQQSFSHFPSLTNQFKSSHLKLRIMRLKNQFTKKITPVKVGLTVALFTATLFLNQNLKAGSPQILTEQVVQTEVDKVAEFPGGQEALLTFINGHLIYPKTMKEQGLKGKVFLQFNVLPDGTLSNFEAIRSPHEDFTNAAIKAMKQMPKWIPAEKDGEKVKMQLTLPINFDMPEPPNSPSK
ncbi:MAG: TonB family protein [Vicingaceae bacterium]|jgi:TonB family protein